MVFVPLMLTTLGVLGWFAYGLLGILCYAMPMVAFWSVWFWIGLIVAKRRSNKASENPPL